MEETLNSYYSLQIEFAKKVSETKSITLDEALLEATSIYKDLGIEDWDFNKENLLWKSFINEYKEKPDPYTITKYCKENIFRTRKNNIFGNFSFEFSEKDKTINIHFQKSDEHNDILKIKNKEKRLHELKNMFTYIKNNYPEARIVKGFSWLYNTQGYKYLFPEKYINNAKINKNWFRSLALWGQFFDENIKLKENMISFFRKKLKNNYNKNELNECFYYKVLELNCDIDTFYSFYNI